MRKILMLLPLLVLTILAFSQTREVTGTVTDPKGSPIPGATIRIKGTRTGTSTDAMGNFKLNVTSKTVLTVSGVGFQTQEFTVGDAATLTISLKQIDASLSEVVVTALGVRRDKRMVSYSTQAVSGEALEGAKTDNIINALDG